MTSPRIATATTACPGLPPGIYDLVVNAAGYGLADVLGVDVTAGNALESLTLSPASSLTGTISLASGGPSETTLQVTAALAGSTDPNQTFTTSSTSSTFNLTGLGAGTYAVTLALPGYITQTVSGVVVAAGQSVDLGNITLDPASEIDGTVTSTDPNNPAAEISVQALQNGTVVAGTVTDSSGNFQLTNLQLGTYTLTVPDGVIVTAPTVTVGDWANHHRPVDHGPTGRCDLRNRDRPDQHSHPRSSPCPFPNPAAL